MDSGRAFQLREQMARRNRLALGICALAALVFICVVVAMVMKYALNMGEAKEDDPARLLQLDGSWGEWLRWSPCSATCGGGSRNRRRYCDDPVPENEGSPCDGEYEQTEVCHDWPCPDCYRDCAEGWLRDCSYCFCAVTSLRGQVHDVTGTPINDVEIFLMNMQWKAISKTDSGGHFVLRNVCKEEMQMIKLTKFGFEPALVNATALSEGNTTDVKVTLHKLVVPRLTMHPEDRTLYEGTTLTLTCRAHPPGVKYEWFKDGNILSVPSERSGLMSHSTARTPRLVITNVGHRDSGSYRCRVVSPGGMVFSRSAWVSVKGHNISDSCQPKPQRRLYRLPANCSIDGVTLGVIDIGYCHPQSCVRGTLLEHPPEGKNLCCGPIKTVTSHVVCDSWSYPIMRILSCGCSLKCGVNIVDARPILGHVSLYDPINGVTDQIQATARYEGKDVQTTKPGSFTLAVPSNRSELVLDFPASSFYNPTIKVIHVMSQSSFVHVTLQSKASPVRVHSLQKMVFPVMSTGIASLPVVSLVLPGGAIIDQHGKVYNNTVDVYTQFFDRRSKDDITSVPGELLYMTKEGQEFHLEMLGMVLLFVESVNQTKLEINSKVNISLDAAGLDLENDISDADDIQNFILNPGSGQWEIAEGQWVCGGKDDCSGKLHCQMDIRPGARFILAARPIPNQELCQVKVSATTDTSPHQSYLPGMEVQVLSKKDDHYVHLSRGVTDSYGTVCLPLPCGYEHVISAEGLMPAESQLLPDAVQYALEGDTVVFYSPKGHLIKTGEGPVHLSCTHTCGKDNYDRYKFEFTSAGHTADVTSVLRENRGTLTVAEPRPHLPLSWYLEPGDSTERSACAVRLTLKGIHADTQVVAVSRVNRAEGQLLGTFTGGVSHTTSSSYSVCLLVRCPDNQGDSSSISTHVTLYIVHQTLKVCQINPVNKGPIRWDQKDLVEGYTSLGFVINPSNGESVDNRYGYFQTRGRGTTAVQWALYKCTQSETEGASTLTCGTNGQ